MLTRLQCWILKRISPEEPQCCSGAFYIGKSKLRVQLGDDLLSRIPGKTVIDFGCGEGIEAIELVQHGASRVLGVDICEASLQRARQRALAAGVGHICRFAAVADELADTIISVDAFEHFDDPAEILNTMRSLLKPDGEVVASFGPTWYHPLGGHLFSAFPWAHLIFSDRALIRWRSAFRADRATRLNEVEGGLNRMTIRRFEKLARSAGFRIDSLETVPIRRLRALHSRWTREFTTAVVRCRLVKPA